jgi:hypothetical protein
MYIIYKVGDKRYAAGPYRDDEIMSHYHDLQYMYADVEKIVTKDELDRENGIIMIKNYINYEY